MTIIPARRLSGRPPDNAGLSPSYNEVQQVYMKYLLILALAATLPLGLVAQDASQSQLPTAPSATKYPPHPTQTAPPANQSSSAPASSPAPAQNTAPAQNSASNGSTSQSAQASALANPGGTTANGIADTNDDVPIIRKRVDEVNVVFTVTDKRDHFVKDLTQSDFHVLDDNKPGVIDSFSHETNLPLRVGLLIDASNSVRDRFKFEQESAIEFLNQIIRPNYDKAFVIGFDTTPEVTQDFTGDAEALSHGVRMLRPGGGTALYDAVYFACRDKLMKADRGVLATRRAIILLSDGEDNQSRVSREEAIEMAQRAEVIIYTISTNTSGMKLRGDKVLEHFA